MTLKELFKVNGLSQQDIADILCEKYQHYKYQQQVSQWCSGAFMPDIKSVFYLSKILNTTTDYIIECILDV